MVSETRFISATARVVFHNHGKMWQHTFPRYVVEVGRKDSEEWCTLQKTGVSELFPFGGILIIF
jgi:hypothetical protein